MFFSVNTFMWTGTFNEHHLPLLEQIKSWGADGVELACSKFDNLPISAIRRELARLGMRCTLSSSPPSVAQSLIHQDPDTRKIAVSFLKNAVDTAVELGATLLVGPLYAPVAWFTGSRPTNDQFRWAVDGFRELVPTLEATGLRIAIEPMNRFETFFLPTAAAGVRLCEAIGSDHIGLMLDTAHMVIEEKDLDVALQTAGRWLLHLQVSENDRGTPGSGRVIDWRSLFRTLREMNYAGGCSIESFPFLDPEGAAKTWCWRDLARSPDEIAREGLPFLRRIYQESLA